MKRSYNFDEIPKPCHVLGFCPYGPLVEDFPLHEQAKQYARDHNMWVKLIPGKGWTKCDKDDPEATEDLNHAVNLCDDPYSCEVFGHDCPVYYVAEDFVDEDDDDA